MVKATSANVYYVNLYTFLKFNKLLAEIFGLETQSLR